MCTSILGEGRSSNLSYFGDFMPFRHIPVFFYRKKSKTRQLLATILTPDRDHPAIKAVVEFQKLIP